MNEKVKRIVKISALGAFFGLWSIPALAADPPAPTPPAADSTPPTAPATPPASEPSNVIRAQEKKAEGDKAMDSLRYAEALVAYNESYALDPKPALLYNLGRTHEALDQLPQAVEKLEAFQKTAPPELLARVPNLKDRIANIKKRVSQLTINVNVPGARIFVRDVVVGQSPLGKTLALKAGKANILIEAPGYFTYQSAIELPGGGGYTVDAQLASRTRASRIIVLSPKDNVSIAVDGKRLGQAPVETIVDPGAHTIEGKHEEHSDFSTSVIVKAGDERTVMVQLGPKPVYKQWWFWTAIGTAAAAGTAIALVVTSERAPDRGDIPPGQLRPAFFVTSPVFKF
jgi:hypothetical protein